VGEGNPEIPSASDTAIKFTLSSSSLNGFFLRTGCQDKEYSFAEDYFSLLFCIFNFVF